MLSLPIISAIIFYGVFIVAGIVGGSGTRYGSYLRRASQNERVFYKPLVQRIGAALMAFAFLTLPLVFAENGWGQVLLALLPCLAMGGLLVRLSGPNELHLNLEERTYCWVRGWPLLPIRQRGSFADMAGVFVRVLSSNSGKSYSVGIRGKAFGVMFLGSFETQTAAEKFAQELMAEISVPRALSVMGLF